MKQLLITQLVCFALLAAATAPAIAQSTAKMTEAEKIESLIKTIRHLKDAVFIRNGKEYDCNAAADHLQGKWSRARDKIKTARQFIDQIASKSSQSGEPYLIRFKDGKEVTSGKFLSEALDELENSAATKPTLRTD